MLYKHDKQNDLNANWWHNNVSVILVNTGSDVISLYDNTKQVIIRTNVHLLPMKTWWKHLNTFKKMLFRVSI